MMMEFKMWLQTLQNAPKESAKGCDSVWEASRLSSSQGSTFKLRSKWASSSAGERARGAAAERREAEGRGGQGEAGRMAPVVHVRDSVLLSKSRREEAEWS